MDMPNRRRASLMRASLVTVVLMVSVLATGTSCHDGKHESAQASDPRDWLERIVVDLERINLQGGSLKVPELKRAWRDDQMKPLLHRAYHTIDSLLGRDSVEARTIALTARLQMVSSTYGVDWDEENPRNRKPRDYFDKVLATLDRGIAAAPQNAELRYRKGRVCGELIFDEYGGSADRHPLDRIEAAENCRRAFELDSTGADYRKFLAVFLLMGPHPEEAEPYVRGQRGELAQLHALLVDWEALPIPPSAVIDPRTADLENERLYDNVIDDWTMGRLRVMRFDGPASDIEAFYRQTMPGFRLYPTPQTRRIERGATNSHQIFVMRDGRYTPAASAEQCKKLNKPWSGPMMELIVSEFHDTPEGAARPYCTVTFLNWRKPGSIDEGR
jgi:hypothetical protein